MDIIQLRRLLLGVSCLVVVSVCSSRAETVTIAWDPNQEIDLAGYRVYYGELEGSTNMIDVANTTTNSIDSLVPETTYFFYVTAYNTTQLESDPSEILTYTVPEIIEGDLPPVISFSSDIARIGPGTLVLEPTVEDDHLSPEELEYTWEWFGGLVPPVFSSTTSQTTTLTLPDEGVYFVRLNVNDGTQVAQKEITISVYNDNPENGSDSTPELTSIAPVTGGLELSWVSAPGSRYMIGCLNELGETSWTMVGGTIDSQGLTTTHVFPEGVEKSLSIFKIFEVYSH